MKTIFSILIGAAIGVSATLIHQSYPPVGVLIAITATYIAIWWLGRFFGKRRYKLAALIAWSIIILRAGSFGAGHELLIQGDNSGTALLALGFIFGVVALFRRL
jgi:hypothetical protein